MRKELDELLCKKYPKIFRDRHAPMNETCMCWGFDCGDGWFNIIDQLCANIQWHINQRTETNDRNRKYILMVNAARIGDFSLFDEYYTGHNYKEEWIASRREEILVEEIPEWRHSEEEIPQVVATQVKEKFGTLRFYYNGGDEYIRGLESMAEAMSAVMCEECGNPGKLRRGGWIRTLCDEHAIEKGYGENES